MERAIYSTDLTDRQFEIIQKYFPSPSIIGRPRSYALRGILNAIFYLVHTGCQWRELPHDFPLIVKVHDANLSDGKKSVAIFQTLFLWFASIKLVWADAAYKGDLVKYLLCAFQCRLEITLTLKGKGFQVVPRELTRNNLPFMPCVI